MCSATSLLTSCCFLRARQSGFFLVLSCCGCRVCRAIAVVGGTTPKDYVEQLTCRSMKAISQGVLEPSEDRW